MRPRDKKAEARALAPTGGLGLHDEIEERSVGDLLPCLFNGLSDDDFAACALEALYGDLYALAGLIDSNDSNDGKAWTDLSEHVRSLASRAYISAELARRIHDANKKE